MQKDHRIKLIRRTSQLPANYLGEPHKQISCIRVGKMSSKANLSKNHAKTKKALVALYYNFGV